MNLGIDKLEKYQKDKPEVVKRLKEINKVKVKKVIKNLNVSSVKQPLNKGKNLFINKVKKIIPKDKQKLAGRTGNILSVMSFTSEFNDRKKALIAQGYTPKEARNRALTVELGGLAGEIGVGGTASTVLMKLAGLASVKTGGIAAVPAYGAAVAGSMYAYQKGEQIGEGGGKWLAKKLGMKVDQETLNRRLAIRQQTNNKLAEMKAQAGGAN